MFGLQHCYYFQCALNESSSIGEAEHQPLFLCPVCLRKLHKVLKFDVAKRYHLIHQKLSDVYSVLQLHEAPQVVKTVEEKPHEQTSSENPPREEMSLVISSSPGRKLSDEDQPETTKLHQQEKFTEAIEWLKKCIHFIDNIT